MPSPPAGSSPATLFEVRLADRLARSLFPAASRRYRCRLAFGGTSVQKNRVVYHNTFFSEVHDMGPVSNVHYRNKNGPRKEKQ